MSGFDYIKKNILSNYLLFTLIYLLFCTNSQVFGACRGEGFMGISSKDPIMSWVDLTFSPVYTSASTSGTSGCKNWDFPYERYIEYVLRNFLQKSHKHLIVESVQGHGIHTEALSMMACPKSSFKIFSGMMMKHRQQTINIFKTAEQSPQFLSHLRKWIKEIPELNASCSLT